MKKIMLLSATVIILFCIVPISKTQAMLYLEQEQGTIAFKQNKICAADIALKKSDCKSSTAGLNILHDTLIAQAGAGAGNSGGSGSSGNVSRSGHGRAKRGDDYNANSHKDKAAQKKESEWPEGEWPEDEDPKGEWGDAEYPED